MSTTAELLNFSPTPLQNKFAKSFINYIHTVPIYLEWNIKNAELYLFCVNGYKQCTRKCSKVETDWEIPKFVNFSNMFMLSILLSAGRRSIQMKLEVFTW